MAGKITFKDAKLIWRNFRGEASDFNAPGARNFAVLIEDEELAKQLIEDGWNLKKLKGNDEDALPAWALKVKVKYGIRPPKVYLVTYPKGKMKKTMLDEETISTLDWAEPQKVDLIVSAYEWTAHGNKGTAAYLDVMYYTPIADELADDYEESDYDEDGNETY